MMFGGAGGMPLGGGGVQAAGRKNRHSRGGQRRDMNQHRRVENVELAVKLIGKVGPDETQSPPLFRAEGPALV